jgi:hypothetical protein
MGVPYSIFCCFKSTTEARLIDLESGGGGGGTYSTDVNTMLASVDNAGIRSAIGVGTTDAPTFLSVTAAGSAISSYTLGATGGGRSAALSLNNGGGIGGLGIASNYVVAWSSANSSGPLGNDAGNFGLLDLCLTREAGGILAQRNLNTGATQVFRLYNGTDSTVGGANPTNFDRAAFSFTSGNFRIAAEYSNTGAYTTARGIDFATDGAVRAGILSNGTMVIGVGFKPLKVSASSVAGSSCVAEIGGSGEQTITGRAGGSYGWATGSEALHTNRDTALFRNAAGVVEINNGTLGSFRDLQLRNLLTSGNVNIADTWNAPALAVTAGSANGVTTILNFPAQATAIPAGSTIVVAGVNPAGYNGTYVVTSSATNAVAYASTNNATYVSGGTIERVFTSVKLNVTDTASNAASKLMDLQVGGVSKFNVDKGGQFSAGGGNFNTTITRVASTLPIALGGNGYIGFGPFFNPDSAALDAILIRDAPGILAQRNGTLKQVLRVYNTALSGAPEWGGFDWQTTANTLRIGTDKSGTGASQPIEFVVGGVVRMSLPVTGGAIIQGLTVGRGGGASDRNSAFGINALATNTTGVANVAIGASSLYVCSTGNANTGIGEYALYLTNGSDNTGIGWHALYGQTTGQKSTSIGSRAGEFISGGAASLITVNQGTFLGADTKALADSSTNETVIGYNATGSGSNTATLNNTSATLTKINGTSAHVLDVTGTIRLTPPASVTPANNGQLMVEATSNTTLTFKFKGSDGTVRSGTVILS